MSYAVFLEETSAVLPERHIEEAGKRLRTESLRGSYGHPFKWEGCGVKAILESVGFWFEMYKDDLIFQEYDGKSCDEYELIRCICDLMTGTMVWRGEDHERWMWEFTNSSMREYFPLPAPWKLRKVSYAPLCHTNPEVKP